LPRRSLQQEKPGEIPMTISLTQLWLPIVVGTGLAWIASGLIHMVIKWHNADYQKLGNEIEVMEAVGNGSPPLGLHAFPFCIDMNEMRDEAVQQRFKDGPVGFLTILPNGMPNMGKLMFQQISFFLVGCVAIAYCARLALDPGTDYMVVFRFVGTVGFLTFGWATIPFSIWFGHTWGMTARYLADAFIYGMVIAGSFAWMWPGPAS
jgi:hypothetical protein